MINLFGNSVEESYVKTVFHRIYGKVEIRVSKETERFLCFEDVAVFATDDPRYYFSSSFFMGKWYTFIYPGFYVGRSFIEIQLGLNDLGIFPIKESKHLTAFTTGKYIGVYEKGKPWKIQKVNTVIKTKDEILSE